jgi:hypothetical protein
MPSGSKNGRIHRDGVIFEFLVFLDKTKKSMFTMYRYLQFSQNPVGFGKTALCFIRSGGQNEKAAGLSFFGRV